MSSDTDFQFVMSTVFGQKKDSPMSMAFFINSNITDVAAICSLHHEPLNKIKYRDTSFKPPIDDDKISIL
jgi:hypothetical protein